MVNDKEIIEELEKTGKYMILSLQPDLYINFSFAKRKQEERDSNLGLCAFVDVGSIIVNKQSVLTDFGLVVAEYDRNDMILYREVRSYHFYDEKLEGNTASKFPFSFPIDSIKFANAVAKVDFFISHNITDQMLLEKKFSSFRNAKWCAIQDTFAKVDMGKN